MATKAKTAGTKGPGKRSTGSSKSSSSSQAKKASSTKSAAKPTQQKTKSAAGVTKKKPPHLRYSETELGVPQLNGIRPTGVQKRPNAKKGKTFVDDKDGMNAILAMVMAEKEGNIESKMMRARQLEEVREARRHEAEKRAESKKEGLEERKREIKDNRRKKRHTESDAAAPANGTAKKDDEQQGKAARKPKKRVSFG